MNIIIIIDYAVRLTLLSVFIQGDKEVELGLPISPLCDRKNTLVSESQIGN